MTPDSISIIVPTLNEEGNITACLTSVRDQRARDLEIIVVDGGSDDDTCARAALVADKVLFAPSGRASQMNFGAHHAGGAILLFLHADTCLPKNAVALMRAGLNAQTRWGRFDVQLQGKPRWLLNIISAMMNLRSRWSHIATGDQAIFMYRNEFHEVGGFPNIALMEDIALSRALKRRSGPLCLRAKVRASARRWEHHGPWRTIVLMWRLRLAYFLGADPDRLARRYPRCDDYRAGATMQGNAEP